MGQAPGKAFILKGKEIGKVTKFSISYIRISTKRQTKADESGIK